MKVNSVISGGVMKIFLNEEEVQVTSAGQLDEIILELEATLPKDRRSKAYRQQLEKLYECYRLYNQITNHRSYNV